MHVYEILEDKESYYIVTELIEGGQLDERLLELKTIHEKDVVNIIH